MSKQERHRIYEYAMDRKNKEMRELEEKLIAVQEANEREKTMVILAEVFLFLLGMLIGALLMRGMV